MPCDAAPRWRTILHGGNGPRGAAFPRRNAAAPARRLGHSGAMGTLRHLAAVEGLTICGAFHPGPGDGVPPLPGGEPAATLALLGLLAEGWPVFAASREAGDGAPDPLDRWSRRVLGGLAAAFGAVPLFPFGGPPFLPFQRWAQRAGPF